MNGMLVMSEDPLSNLNVEELMQEIQERVRQRAQALNTPGFSAGGAPKLAQPNTHVPAPQPTARSLDRFVEALASTNEKIGLPPSMPRTLRGRVGHFLIRVIARFLWWYTGQLQDQVTAALALDGEQNRAIEMLERSQREQMELSGHLNQKVLEFESSQDRNRSTITEQVADSLRSAI